MKSLFSRSLSPNRRATLADLHRLGILQVFRRPSLFRLWAPLRESSQADSFEA